MLYQIPLFSEGIVILPVVGVFTNHPRSNMLIIVSKKSPIINVQQVETGG